MQRDVKSADMKYLATMAKNEGVPLTQKKKKKQLYTKRFVGKMFSLLSWFQ